MNAPTQPTRSAQKEALWRERMEQQVASGQTIKAYCHEQHIGKSTFSAWRRRLSMGDGTATNHATARFIEAGSIKAAAVGTLTDGQRIPDRPPSGIDIHLELGGGVVLHIRRP